MSRLRFILKWLPTVGLLAYTYYPTFLWMVDRWTARDSYFGHGFLIPLVSLYWIFKKRKELAQCFSAGACDRSRASGIWGFALVAAGVLIQLFSSVFRIYFISAFSLVVILLGLTWYAFGSRVTKRIWFPIVFLVLMIPLPLLFISDVTLNMKFFVSELSTHMLNAVGIESMRQGSYIHTPHAIVLVGDPCSGLRSFLAFLCLGIVFAYRSQLSLGKKLILVLAGLPLALFSNVIRVFVMGLLAEIYGMELIATKIVHDGGGILTFIIALTCFVLLRQKLEGLRAEVG